MPRKKTHQKAGVFAGASNALLHASDLPVALGAFEVLGGAVGGLAGGMLPDLLEPPTTPRHRSAFHSYTTALGLVTAAGELVQLAHTYLRQVAADAFAFADREGGLFALIATAAGWALHALAGACHGLQAGYLSHLALDSRSPAGLPVLA